MSNRLSRTLSRLLVASSLFANSVPAEAQEIKDAQTEDKITSETLQGQQLLNIMDQTRSSPIEAEKIPEVLPLDEKEASSGNSAEYDEPKQNPDDAVSRFPDPEAIHMTARKIAVKKIIKQDPEKFCLPVRDAVQYQDVIANLYQDNDGIDNKQIKEFEALSPQQRILTRAVNELALNSQRGNFWVNLNAQADTMICGTYEFNRAAGVYIAPIQAAIITLKKPNYSLDPTTNKPVCMVSNLDDSSAENLGILRFTIAEEFIHRGQNYMGSDLIGIDGDDAVNRGVSALHVMATEAQAKTIVSMIAVEEVMEGDGLIMTTGNQMASYDRQAMLEVSAMVMGQGEGILQDANNLTPVMMGIMGDAEFQENYILSSSEIYNANKSIYEPTFLEYARLFDSIPGASGNLISGQFKSYRDLVASIPDSPAKSILIGQFEQTAIDKRPLFPVQSDIDEPKCVDPADKKPLVSSVAPSP